MLFKTSISLADNFVSSLKAELKLPKNSVLTVCQDVNCLSIITYFKQLGISDIFWSHTTKDQATVSGIRLHPFPLYSDLCANYTCADYSSSFDFIHQSHALPKKYLFSFVGSGEFKELNWIYELANIEGTFIASHPEGCRNYGGSEDCRDYCNILQDSLFSLCPTFYGANNIRIWESLSVGAIPVIISDDLCLPGNRMLWESSCVFLAMDQAEIANLPDALKHFKNDENRIFAMQDGCRQLWSLVWTKYFCKFFN